MGLPLRTGRCIWVNDIEHDWNQAADDNETVNGVEEPPQVGPSMEYHAKSYHLHMDGCMDEQVRNGAAWYINMYMYHSIPGKRPLPGKHPLPGKRPGTYFAGVNENTTVWRYAFSIPGKRPRVQILRVMKERPWALILETTVHDTCTCANLHKRGKLSHK